MRTTLLVIAVLAVPTLSMAMPRHGGPPGEADEHADPDCRHPGCRAKHPLVTMAEFHPASILIGDNTHMWLGGTLPMTIAEGGQVLVQGTFTFAASNVSGGTLCTADECVVAHAYVEACFRVPPDTRPISVASIPTGLQFQPRFTSADGNTWENNVNASPSYVFTAEYGATFELGFCAWKPYPDRKHADVEVVYQVITTVKQ